MCRGIGCVGTSEMRSIFGTWDEIRYVAKDAKKREEDN